MPDTVLRPDPRMRRRGEVDQEALQARYADIAHLSLPDAVPEPVRIHFETAKNVWLYAWFVYRFHMVAAQYVLTTLEFALRTRLRSDGLISADTTNQQGLSRLLKTAQVNGLITNARFGPSKQHADMRAMSRQEKAVDQTMLQQGLQAMEWGFDDRDVRHEDWEDLLAQFVEFVPKLRNEHAHGTSMLKPSVLGTFESVHDLICQLWDVSGAFPQPR